jgi:hypothetical protein
MAGLAVFFGGRATGNAFFGVSGDHVGFEVILMTAFTDFHPDRPIASSGFQREDDLPEEKKNGNDGDYEYDSSHHTLSFLNGDLPPKK